MERATRWYNRLRADAMDVLALSIAGSLDKDAAKVLQEEARKLRGSR